MKLFTKLCIPAALLALAAVNASASTCVSDNLNDFVTNVGSCTIGDLTFSNFFFNYTAGVNTGSPLGLLSPATPNTNTQVILSWNEITDGVSSDPNGTVGTAGSPVYQFITDYSGGNSVNEFQNEHFFIQYSVTDNTTGTVVTQVDDNIAGGSTQSLGASATFTNKTMCVGGQFVQSGGIPSGVCSTGGRNLYQAVDLAGGGTALTSNPDSGEADSSVNYSTENAGIFNGTTAGGETSFGVYDQADMNGGNTDPSATANITSVENDFVVQSTGGTPEPATFILLGGALVGLGALRRSRKTV